MLDCRWEVVGRGGSGVLMFCKPLLLDLCVLGHAASRERMYNSIVPTRAIAMVGCHSPSYCAKQRWLK